MSVGLLFDALTFSADAGRPAPFSKEPRKEFERLGPYDQASVIEFLKTLQVLPPGTASLIVDENFHEKQWPPGDRSNSSVSGRSE